MFLSRLILKYVVFTCLSVVTLATYCIYDLIRQTVNIYCFGLVSFGSFLEDLMNMAILYSLSK